MERRMARLELDRRNSLLVLVSALAACTAGPDASSSAESTPRTSGAIVADVGDSVLFVFQAKNGDYWFGSDDRGVYRYDGKTLVNFSTEHGLSGNSIRGIQEDAAGVVYVMTYAGIDAFDGRGHERLRESEASATGDWVLRPDDLWFTAGQDTGAVYRYDGELLHRLKFPQTAAGDAATLPRSLYPNAKFSPYDVYTIVKDSQGSLWFGTASLGVCRCDGKSFAWLPDSELHNANFGARSIVEDKDGKFWFGESSSRYSVDLRDPSAPRFVSEVGLRDPRDPQRGLIDGIISGLVDRAGVLWLASYGGGVVRYDGTSTTHYPVTDRGVPITVFSIHEDVRGVLWLGTHKAGPYKFDGEKFERFRF
ncbi:MAG: hypothetical protein EPO68_03485 [Planctomycetota bacterium]|nr:MAG: hypothetical protein EPO68_03485 [Planctomycetota bacterium]